MEKMQKIKPKVLKLLIEKPHLRDDDNRLIANIFLNEGGGTEAMQKISAFEFLRLFSDGKFTNFESIRRMRAKLQEEHPELRGKSYKERQKKGSDTTISIKSI